MGWDADQAEDAYWEMRAQGLTHEVIMAEPDPNEDIPDPWSDAANQEPDDPGAEEMHTWARGFLNADPELMSLLWRAGNPAIRHAHPNNPTKGQTMDYLDSANEHIYETGAPWRRGRLDTITASADAGRSVLRAFTPGASRDEILTAMAALAGKLSELDRLPEEPALSDDEPCVIMFTRSFYGKTYTYAAVRVPSMGKWCVTGKKAPQYKTWTELVTWIKTGKAQDEPLGIRLVGSWMDV